MAREQRPAIARGLRGRGHAGGSVGAPASVPALLAHLTERWDGKGPLRRAKGEQIPLPMRIVHVAMDAALQRLLGGEEHAVRLVRERAGHAFDPEVAACLVSDGAGDPRARRERLGVGRGARPGAAATARCWRRTRSIARLPRWGTSPTWSRRIFTGHSAGVADLAGAAAQRCGIDAVGVHGDPAGRASPRPRPGGGPPADLAEARAADSRRMGAGATAPLPHRARPLALAFSLGALPGRGGPS